MSKVREVAWHVVEALPPDADFSDLDELLRERAEVEQARDDFEAAAPDRWRRLSLKRSEFLPQAKWNGQSTQLTPLWR